MKLETIDVEAVYDDINGALQTKNLFTCHFCEKTTSLSNISREICKKLSPKNTLFCRFCLRNNLTSRDNRHTLIMTFRPTIGYLYYSAYRQKKKGIYFAEITDMIHSHEQVGLLNPAFKYDPESMLWFIDFQKIGSSGRKIPVQEVHNTVLNMISCFNLNLYHSTFKPSLFYKKYQEAIDLFYEKRMRPEGKRILKPTLQNCGFIENKDIPWDKTKEFLPKHMTK